MRVSLSSGSRTEDRNLALPRSGRERLADHVDVLLVAFAEVPHGGGRAGHAELPGLAVELLPRGALAGAMAIPGGAELDTSETQFATEDPGD